MSIRTQKNLGLSQVTDLVWLRDEMLGLVLAAEIHWLEIYSSDDLIKYTL